MGLTIVLTILMLLAGRFPRWWWLPAGALFTAVAFVLILVLPYFMTIGDRKPHHTKLAAQVRALERKEGIGGTPIYIENASERTTQANAESVGIGPSARVVVWDTLLNGRYSPGEIRVVAAHEFGHVARATSGRARLVRADQIPGVLRSSPRLTQRRGGMAPARGRAFALLVIMVSISRDAVQERRLAPLRSRGRLAARCRRRVTRVGAQALRGLPRYDLQQPDPPVWSYIWIDNHPTLAQRIAMARAWAAKHSR